MYMRQIYHNIHVVLSKAAHEYNDQFGYLPTTHVEASFKGWPNNHVRGCILEELLVIKSGYYIELL